MGNRSLKAALVAAALLGAVVAMVPASPASAGISVLIPVSVTADLVDGNTTPGNISLREAVNIANTDGQLNTISLGVDQTYQLTLCASNGNEDEDANANGDLDLFDGDDITIDGNGSTIRQTCDEERVLDKLGTGQLTIDQVTITGGSPSGDGGGVLVGNGLTVQNGSLLTGNMTFGDGGGAYSGGPMNVQDSSVAENTTITGGGGGIASFDDVTLLRASVHDNRSFTGAGGIYSDDGGVFVTSSSVVHNLAENNGGISADEIELEYATVLANSGRQGFATDNLDGGLSITAFASVIGLGGPSDDCSATAFTSNGFNLGYDTSCELDHATDLPGTYPHLNVPGFDDGPDEGGEHHPPVEPSRAIDRIPPACGADLNDQLDGPRPTDDGCEVGAREVSPEDCTGAFEDVSASHLFASEICWMGQIGISIGFPDGTFKPSAPVTRQSMAAFVFRLAGTPPYDPQGETFNDVSSSHPFYAEIEWMAETGIATGFDGDVYLPAANVSRQAMSAFMYRVAGEPPFVPAGQTFTDVSPTHPFYAEIEWMADEEISTGFLPGPQYRPSIPVSRQAMAAFMLRLAEGPPLAGL